MESSNTNSTQSQNSVDSFSWQWTEQSVFETPSIHYRRYFKDMHLWHNSLDGKVIADIGSGNGRHVYSLSLLSKAKEIYSIELSNISVAHQRKIFTDSRIKIIQADAAEVQFKADFIFLLGMIQHTKDPAKTFKNIYSCLNDEGELVVSFYMYTPATVALEPLRTVLKHFPKSLLWKTCWLLAPIYLVRQTSRESSFWNNYKNAHHTAYDWFGSHYYQHYFTESSVADLFAKNGINKNNYLKIGKGLYKVKKTSFPHKEFDQEIVFGKDSSLMTK